MRWLAAVGTAFVILHQPNGQPVRINPDHVDSISPADAYNYPGAHSVLSINGSAKQAVQETPEEVARLLSVP